MSIKQIIHCLKVGHSEDLGDLIRYGKLPYTAAQKYKPPDRERIVEHKTERRRCEIETQDFT